MKKNLFYFAYAGVAVVVAALGFYFGPKFVGKPGEPATSFSTPQGQTTEGAASAAKGDRAGGSTDGQTGTDNASAGSDMKSATGEAPAAGDNAQAQPDTASADTGVPGFDVLRVEPDGSTVIAGSGTPGTKLEIMDGDKVIATTEIGPSGDFAAVLDQPLPAGDYQLQLRTTAPDGTQTMSADVATVSVPKDPTGQLLAMVGKPGEASRVLVQPEAASAGGDASAAQSGAADVNSASGTASDAVATAGADAGAAAGATADAAAGATADAAAGATADAAASNPAAGIAGLPALPDASGDIFASAPAINAETPAGDALKTEAGGATVPATMPEVATDGPPATVRVEAVELEDGKIFIAGKATPGGKVQLSADGILIGETEADSEGRFLVEGRRDLAVGDHEISASLVDDSGKALLTAVVPFNRPEGDKLAAVAGGSGAGGEQAGADSAQAGSSSNEATSSAAAGSANPGSSGASATAPATPAGSESAAASVAGSAGSASGAEGGATTVQQAPLTAAAGSVIIRKGDTLWQISRRTYGQGVRYTTIYLANRAQINNPNMIAPGQVFSMPSEPMADEKALEIHHDLIEGKPLPAN